MTLQMPLKEIILLEKRMNKNLLTVVVVAIHLISLDLRVPLNKFDIFLDIVTPSRYDKNTLDRSKTYSVSSCVDTTNFLC